MDILTLVAFAAAAVSIGGAVFSVLFVRRGSDAELKSDVEELALLVDRLSKTQRRERMARVRQGVPDTQAPQNGSEALQAPLDFPQDIKAHKAELRRRLRGRFQ